MEQMNPSGSSMEGLESFRDPRESILRSRLVMIKGTVEDGKDLVE